MRATQANNKAGHGVADTRDEHRPNDPSQNCRHCFILNAREKIVRNDLIRRILSGAKKTLVLGHPLQTVGRT